MIKEFSWDQFTFFKPLLQEYSRIDSILQARIDIQLEKKPGIMPMNYWMPRSRSSFWSTPRGWMSFVSVEGMIQPIALKISVLHYLWENLLARTYGEFWWDEMPDYLMRYPHDVESSQRRTTGGEGVQWLPSQMARSFSRPEIASAWLRYSCGHTLLLVSLPLRRVSRKCVRI